MKPIDPEKLRDMVRSILPSRYRTGPRKDKALRKRAHRRAIRVDLRHQDHEQAAADLLRDVSVADIVQYRRYGDKLAHFMRWCEAITKGMTTEDALGYVRGILPKSLIGEHAYGHWEIHRKYLNANFLPFRETLRRRAQSYHDSATFRLRRALENDPWLHARLNAEIKSRNMFDPSRRLLLGLHDVESFVHDIRPREPDPYYSERVTMLRLIDEVEKGGRKAALRIWRRRGTRGIDYDPVRSISLRRHLPGMMHGNGLEPQSVVRLIPR
jgi:hypothetical protein